MAECCMDMPKCYLKRSRFGEIGGPNIGMYAVSLQSGDWGTLESER